MQRRKSIMSKKSLQGLTNDGRFRFSVGVTMWAV